MPDETPIEKWQVRVVRSGVPGLDRLPGLGLPDLARLPWLNHPVRPADIGGALHDVMLTRGNMLEDVNYTKVVPNHYMVEISQASYTRLYHPIEIQVVQQWRERLLEDLLTANSRQGRKEFRFGGRVRVEVRPASDLKDNEARILSRIEPDQPRSAAAPSARSTQVTPPPGARPHAVPPLQTPNQAMPPLRLAQPPAIQAAPAPGEAKPVLAPAGPPAPQPANQVAPPPHQPGATGPRVVKQRSPAAATYLEMAPGGQRWALYPGTNTIGRSDVNQIYLDFTAVQENRLISGQHAYIVMDGSGCTLHDGSPDGRPSANGTYVNLRRVPPGGVRLQNGDSIILAAADPLYPRSDTPGVVTFYFWTDRRD